LDGDQIVLLGRLKDMLIRGDHNIYPELYEPLVERIEGVRRAAIVGDFDSVNADERMILVVEADAGVDPVALHDRVRREVRAGPHRLDASAQPDEIVVRDLPESGRSRKIDKAALRVQLGARPCA
jgi:acyl-CoA synthetase (AMP-forming)/AMP-acid ligase II